MTTTIVSFVIVIGVLILIHEFGHFAVARLTGVGVERFSIGFGPVLLRWRGKETEYCLSALPLGGYVKMLGEENPLEGGGVMEYDPRKAFALKPLWARFLIVFAGPGMNFVLAAVLVAGVLATFGRPVWPALIGRVTQGGPAATAGVRTGDLVVAVNGRAVAYWEDLQQAVAASHGQPLTLTVRHDAAERTVTVSPALVAARDPVFKDPVESWDLGASSQNPPVIVSVMASSPAERAGVKPGDVAISVAGQPVYSRDELQQEIQKRPGQAFDLVVLRDGVPRTLRITAAAEKEKALSGGEITIGRIGVGIEPKTIRTARYGPVTAVVNSVAWTRDMTVLTFKSLWKIVSGQIAASNIGGPLQIASETGRQAREGVAQIMLFTAVISVNLAVLNLLPVPMLDGGHLFFFVIEGLRGQPLSLRKREAAQQLGFVLLMLLMVYAFYNDLVRLDVLGSALKLFR